MGSEMLLLNQILICLHLFSVHPSCMDYSEKLIKKIFQSASWQCTNCKTCHVCQEANDDVSAKPK